MVELRDKLGKQSLESFSATGFVSNINADAVNALIGLGIGRPMAENAVKKVTDSNKDQTLEEIIKQALKNL